MGTKITGKNGVVYYGTDIVAEQVSWSMSGFSMPVTAAATPFGDTIKVYEAADAGEPGTIDFNGNYDPTVQGTTGVHALLKAACAAGTHLGTTAANSIYLYANTSTLWRVAAGGYIIVTKADAITLPRNAFGTIAFSGQVSTQAMEQVGTGT